MMDAINASEILNSNEINRLIQNSNIIDDFGTIKLKTIDSNFKKVFELLNNSISRVFLLREY